MRLPQVSAREMARFLERHGFLFIRQSGSHRIYTHSDGRRAIIPMHAKPDLKTGTLKAILDDCGIDERWFIRNWKR